MKVTVSGASDDLVEIEGDLREEFNGDDVTLVFGDGTHLRVRYGDEGLWSIERTVAGTATYTRTGTAGDPDGDNYSDRVELEGDLVSVDKVRTRFEIIDALVDATWRNLDDATLETVFAIAKKGGAA